MSSQSRQSSTNARASRILARIRAIPKGVVQTHGDIDPRAPRLVGNLLAAAPDDVPWHRVIRADGTVPMGRPQLERLHKGRYSDQRRSCRPPATPGGGSVSGR